MAKLIEVQFRTKNDCWTKRVGASWKRMRVKVFAPVILLSRRRNGKTWSFLRTEGAME
jgi:hypothetical protein